MKVKSQSAKRYSNASAQLTSNLGVSVRYASQVGQLPRPSNNLIPQKMEIINKNTGEVLKIRTQYTYEFNEKDKETNRDPSDAVPGQAYKVEEILRKYANGIPFPIKKAIAVSDIPESFDDINPLSKPDFDLSDITYAEAVLNSQKTTAPDGNSTDTEVQNSEAGETK